jgi:serine/threonine protein kinase
MSPEQAGGDRVGEASDIFSLGSILVYAATGEGPFGKGSAPALLYRVVHDEPRLDAVPAGLALFYSDFETARREIGRLHEALLAHSSTGYRPAAELLTALHG